jgi:DNA-binding transcriptional regulator YhcF (GntR family)
METSRTPAPLPLRVDRDLPVSIHAQLVGQIEYGVSSGRLPAGSQLPSVRELAERLELSPVTVSNVFRTLRERDLIETVPGRGTFVARRLAQRGASGRALATVHRAVDDLLRLADRVGVPRDELSGLLTARLAQEGAVAAPLDVRFVGIFEEATRDYGRAVARQLVPSCTVRTTVFAALDRPRLAALRHADLLLTFPHRRTDLERLLPDGPPIAGVRFIPSARVRGELAALSPFVRLGLVSSVPEFLPTFLEGVRGLAQHVPQMRGTVLDAPDLDEIVHHSDVVVYATGAEDVVERVPPDVPAFEYRHEPDPVWVENEIVPRVQGLLARRGADDAAADPAGPAGRAVEPAASLASDGPLAAEPAAPKE